MKEFCTECGAELDAGSQHCKNCGTRIEKRSQVQAAPPKKPRSKKQRIMQRVLIGLAVLVIGFSLWAKNYHAAQNTEKRFETAIANEDVKKIQKLAVLDNGQKIKKSEAKALLALAKKKGKSAVSRLSNVIPHGRFIGLFNDHKIQLTAQYIYYDEMDDGLSFEFNGQKVAEHERTDDTITFGPLSPGIYKVQAKFEGEYASTSKSISMTLDDRNLEEQWIDIDLSIAKVLFEISPFDPEMMTDSFISFGDEKFEVNDLGEASDFGPFLIDGSQTVTATTTLPWGKIVSAETAIDDSTVTITPALVTEEQYSTLIDQIVNYGEHYAEAFAMRDASPFIGITPTMKESIEEQFLWLLRNDYFLSSLFTLAEIDKESLQLVNNDEGTGIRLNGQLSFESAVHELTEKPEFENEMNDIEFTFLYDTEKKEWLLEQAHHTNFWDFEATDGRKGSGKLQKPSDALIAKQENNTRDKQIGQFMTDFHDLSVAAINNRDFSYVEDYHTAGGPSGKEAKDYLGYLIEKGITEEHIQTVVEKIEQVDATTWKVTSVDEYIIQKDGDSNKKKYRSVVIIKQQDDYFGMHELISTDEIK